MTLSKSNSRTRFNSNYASTKKSQSRSPSGSKNFLLKRNSVSPVTTQSWLKIISWIWAALNTTLVHGKLASLNESQQTLDWKTEDIVDAIDWIGQVFIFNQSRQTLYEKEIEILKKQNAQMLA